MKRFATILGLVIAFGLPTVAQEPIDFERGFVPYLPYDTSQFDNVNLSTGGLVLHIPIISYPERGTVPALSLFASYNNVAYFAYPIDDIDGYSEQWMPDGGKLLIQDSYEVGINCPGGDGGACYVADADGALHMIG